MTESCPTCHAPVTRGQARCEECQVSFDWFDGGVRPKHPFIRPGAPLLYFDLTAFPLPGQLALHGATSDGTRFDATRDGALVSVPFYRVIDYTRYVATFRCADSIHQIFINGHHVGACIDATFGFGGFGWRLESMDTRPARAIFHSVSLNTVA
ncbi:MAG: hypothetical protein U0270_29805 [Labilithrix sp.]